nr:MAG TPA: hypothetical protein [Caudoviricetes sp.]
MDRLPAVSSAQCGAIRHAKRVRRSRDRRAYAL